MVRSRWTARKLFRSGRTGFRLDLLPTALAPLSLTIDAIPHRHRPCLRGAKGHPGAEDKRGWAYSRAPFMRSSRRKSQPLVKACRNHQSPIYRPRAHYHEPRSAEAIASGSPAHRSPRTNCFESSVLPPAQNHPPTPSSIYSLASTITLKTRTMSAPLSSLLMLGRTQLHHIPVLVENHVSDAPQASSNALTVSLVC